ncbi:Holliday junction resolvase RuvX [filamentous cyanobacterium LEGE 11480]|uniref:Holliday junction resolvase RuvX n=1 Tax=Romeriopsis navalis LEGE 11480 TaxID=2777977 RepID=A0A928VLB3_9CYAN|nr:Holliday junction resolvase RuvX [Romeriopsis navalis]MBE9030703.1 Holliday junction resolvase RuvX [Romeriopsis navalis LEGE 11480]
MYLGFDPGKDKCGVAIVDPHQQPVWHEVVQSAAVLEKLAVLQQQHDVVCLVMGDQTASKHWRAKIQAAFPELAIHQVDERYSSLEARDRYWQMYPAHGLVQLLPQGLRQPPRPVDDIVAILLVERYLAQLATMADEA